ncbi:MAG: hypothetical protein AAB573_03515 [Patescibacteria group bacterium]
MGIEKKDIAGPYTEIEPMATGGYRPTRRWLEQNGVTKAFDPFTDTMNTGPKRNTVGNGYGSDPILF